MTNSPHREPADRRIAARSLVAAQTGPPRATPPTRSANPVRQVAPPTDTAKLLRQSESANQRAPTAGDQLSPPGTFRSSHRISLMSLGSKPHRHRQHRHSGPPTDTAKFVRHSESASQRTPTAGVQITAPAIFGSSHQGVLMSFGSTLRTTGDTANEVRQTGPPNDTAKLLRQAEGANQRAPTVGDQLTPPETGRSSHRNVPISRGSHPYRHRPTPPTRSAKQVRQVGPPADTAKLFRQAESANCR